MSKQVTISQVNATRNVVCTRLQLHSKRYQVLVPGDGEATVIIRDKRTGRMARVPLLCADVVFQALNTLAGGGK